MFLLGVLAGARPTNAAPAGLTESDWENMRIAHRAYRQAEASPNPATVGAIAQQAYVKASNTDAGDVFGFAGAISGNTIVVGAPIEGSKATGVNGDQADNSTASSGAAYVFVRNGTTWTQQAYLKASNTAGTYAFGYSVAISGSTTPISKRSSTVRSRRPTTSNPPLS